MGGAAAGVSDLFEGGSHVGHCGGLADDDAWVGIDGSGSAEDAFGAEGEGAEACAVELSAGAGGVATWFVDGPQHASRSEHAQHHPSDLFCIGVVRQRIPRRVPSVLTVAALFHVQTMKLGLGTALARGWWGELSG